jgi:NAD(P)-dependent dehydrogenase (short-subunit alcohol dehydrogenase family)
MESTFINTFGLNGKSIWVVGAAGYLGQSVTKLLQSAGAEVLCLDIDDRAKTFIDGLPNSNNLIPINLNTRNTAATAGFVAEQIVKTGVPSGLIDLSFASTGKHFDDLTAEDFDQVNHDGLTSTFILSREVGNAMKAQKSGSIVLFSSMYGSVSPDPRAYEAPMNVNPVEYGVGKAGIIQLTRYLAVHFGPDNVRCNCISPGPFPNPNVQQQHPDFVARLAHKVPMGRVGKAEEIAGAAAFLVGNAASFITGQNLFVDGGWTAW